MAQTEIPRIHCTGVQEEENSKKKESESRLAVLNTNTSTEIKKFTIKERKGDW